MVASTSTADEAGPAGSDAGASGRLAPSGPPAKFTEGSLLHHILVMTGTGAVGLMAIFIGDLANLFFLSRLDDVAVVAAVGYASSILFLTISIGIGLSIAATALVSPAVGARDMARAQRLSVNSFIGTGLVAVVSSAAVWVLMPWALTELGASGRTFALAQSYLAILIPSLTPLAIAMTATGLLRSVGDARRAMNVTLTGAIVNVLLDPVLIFWAGMGLEGAALASVIARFFMLAVGLWGAVGVHGLIRRPTIDGFLADVRPIAAIAVPAILTNVSTPFSNAYVTAAVSHYGDGAVAGWTALGRVLPVAFGAVYALSGSIGPILGQNLGSGDGARLKRAFMLALQVNVAFTAVAWVVLALAAEPLAATLQAKGEAATLIVTACRYISPLFVFLGALFVANAAFNTLGHAHLSTILNWGRATLGTVPFVMAGGALGGATGVIAGQMAGGVLFGVAGVVICRRLIARLASSRPDGPGRR